MCLTVQGLTGDNKLIVVGSCRSFGLETSKSCSLCQKETVEFVLCVECLQLELFHSAGWINIGFLTCVQSFSGWNRVQVGNHFPLAPHGEKSCIRCHR